MDAPQERLVPHVPEDLVSRFGTAAPPRPGTRRPPAPTHAIGRVEGWVLGGALVCCLAVVAVIMIATVALTPAPFASAAGLLVLLLVAAVVGRIAARALLRDRGAGRARR